MINPRWNEVYTRQSYGPAESIPGVSRLPIRQFHDDGGTFTELARIFDGRMPPMSNFQPRQINYSECAPGCIKAFHVHERQTDVWYVPPSDRMLIVLFDAREEPGGRPTTMRFVAGDGQSELIVIPPGVAHGVKNLASTTGRIIYFVDQFFSAVDSDEGRLPWDILGPSIWDMTRG